MKGITSNHDGEFFCLNCFHSYTSRNKVKKNMKMYIKITIIAIQKCLKNTKKY